MAFATLLFQAGAMGFSSFFVGLLPLMVGPGTMTGKKMKCAKIIGMGLLVGAALTVVIPEGVSTIYAATEVAVSSNETAAFAPLKIAPSHSTLGALDIAFPYSSPSAKTETRPVRRGHDDDDDGDDDDDDDDDDDEEDDKHTKFRHGSNPVHAIGISLLSGFILMMIIEQVSHSHSSHSHSHPNPHHHHDEHQRRPQTSRAASRTPLLRRTQSQPLGSIATIVPPPASSSKPPSWVALQRTNTSSSSHPFVISEQPEEEGFLGQNELGDGDDGKDQNGKGAGSIDGEEEGGIGGQMSDDQHRHLDPDHDEEEHTGDDVEEKHCPGGGEGAGKSFSATLGLVIHSAADGIALGASATSSKAGLGLVVFLAIFIHKIPASLGLCTTLISDHLPRSQIRFRIGLFSAAAPMGAILTYLAVITLASGLDHKILMWWTGVALLFSGGTFLYVATVIQDLDGPHDPESAEAGEEVGKHLRLMLMIAGMVAPLVLSKLSGHHH